MLVEAAKLRSKNMCAALVVDLNCGLRDKAKVVGRWHDNRTRCSPNSRSRARGTR
jgi:hypothetical protein